MARGAWHTGEVSFTVKRVLIANPHGYCAGVLFALRGADLARQIYPDRPVWVYHEIVHNPDPVNELKGAGCQLLRRHREVPDGAVLLFSAHGVSPSRAGSGSGAAVSTRSST